MAVSLWPQALAGAAAVLGSLPLPTTVAQMLKRKVVIPRKIKIPEKKRTVQTGFRAFTVSMNGIEVLFHWYPCQRPPSHSVTNILRPPIRKNQKLQFASA